MPDIFNNIKQREPENPLSKFKHYLYEYLKTYKSLKTNEEQYHILARSPPTQICQDVKPGTGIPQKEASKKNPHTPCPQTESSLSDLKHDLSSTMMQRRTMRRRGSDGERPSQQERQQERRRGRAREGRAERQTHSERQRERKNRLKHPGEECGVCGTPSIQH